MAKNPFTIDSILSSKFEPTRPSIPHVIFPPSSFPYPYSRPQVPRMLPLANLDEQQIRKLAKRVQSSSDAPRTYFKKPRQMPEKTFPVEYAHSLCGKRLSALFRFGELCYPFMFKRSNSNGTQIYICATCKYAKRKDVKVEVMNGQFLQNPASLPHECEPKNYADEIGKRTVYRATQSLRLTNPRSVNRDVICQIPSNETGVLNLNQHRQVLSGAINYLKPTELTENRKENTQFEQIEKLLNALPSVHSISFNSDVKLSNTNKEESSPSSEKINQEVPNLMHEKERTRTITEEETDQSVPFDEDSFSTISSNNSMDFDLTRVKLEPFCINSALQFYRPTEKAQFEAVDCFGSVKLEPLDNYLH